MLTGVERGARSAVGLRRGVRERPWLAISLGVLKLRRSRSTSPEGDLDGKQSGAQALISLTRASGSTF